MKGKSMSCVFSAAVLWNILVDACNRKYNSDFQETPTVHEWDHLWNNRVIKNLVHLRGMASFQEKEVHSLWNRKKNIFLITWYKRDVESSDGENRKNLSLSCYLNSETKKDSLQLTRASRDTQTILWIKSEWWSVLEISQTWEISGKEK